MPKQRRIKTRYPGVYYIEGASITSGKPERIYYVAYRKGGKLIEEKAGRQYQDDMTPARAAALRSSKINGGVPSNREHRRIQEIQRSRDQECWTVSRLWEEYKANRPHLRGLSSDEYRFRSHIMPTLGNREPGQLSPFDVDRIRIRLSKTHSPQTVRHVLALLRRIANFGVDKRLCDGLQFRIEMPKVNNQKTEDLTPDQLSRLLTVLDEEPDIQTASLMKLALFTGMRKGELLRLQWNDVDFQRGFIAIRDPKGGRDQKIPLNDSARDLLEAHPRSASLYVFPGRDGNQRTRLGKSLTGIRENAGLPRDFRPLHGLRHVYASMLASSGQVDLYTLQKLLTHKSPLMTQRYAHLRDETLRRASNLAGELVQQAIDAADKKAAGSLE